VTIRDNLYFSQLPFDAPYSAHKILIADDDDHSRSLLEAMLDEDGHEVIAATDGRQIPGLIAEHKPDLVLLDVMMPGETGFAICRALKTDPKLRQIPVILVTGLSNNSDRLLGSEVGADEFLTKPIRRAELMARVRALLRLRDYSKELEEAETVLFTLAKGIEAKDPFTEGHCERMSRYAVMLGQAAGLPEEQLTALRRGGMVHDIGKLAVPEEILLKPGALDDHERRIMMEHPAAGAAICAPMRSFHNVLPIIRHHHERMDGSGYPDGLTGNQIPVTARILAIIDVYDAVTVERPYKAAFTVERAIEILRQDAAKGWWDSGLVEEWAGLILSARLEPRSEMIEAARREVAGA